MKRYYVVGNGGLSEEKPQGPADVVVLAEDAEKLEAENERLKAELATEKRLRAADIQAAVDHATNDLQTKLAECRQENRRLRWYLECRMFLDAARRWWSWGYRRSGVGNVWAIRELEKTTRAAEQALRERNE